MGGGGGAGTNLFGSWEQNGDEAEVFAPILNELALELKAQESEEEEEEEHLEGV